MFSYLPYVQISRIVVFAHSQLVKLNYNNLVLQPCIVSKIFVFRNVFQLLLLYVTRWHHFMRNDVYFTFSRQFFTLMCLLGEFLTAASHYHNLITTQLLDLGHREEREILSAESFGQMHIFFRSLFSKNFWFFLAISVILQGSKMFIRIRFKHYRHLTL